MPRAYFLKTTRRHFERQICEMAAGYYEQQRKALIAAADAAQARRLDDLLWSWRQESFVPHLCVDALKEEDAPLLAQMPVLITSGGANPSAIPNLLLADPWPVERLGGFEEIVDFVIDDDEPAKAEARRRFRRYREAGLDPQLIS